MTKNKFFRIGKRPIDARQIGFEVKEELERQQEEIMEAAKDIYVAKLEDLLDNLRANSAMRGMGFYAARYNNPFEDAKVIAKRTATGYQIYVDDKRFQYLDEGRPEQTVTKEVRFPFYVQPTATQGVSRGQPGSLVIKAPAHIIAFDGPIRTEAGSPTQRARQTGDAELDAFFSDNNNIQWARKMPGDKIAARKPRNFYRTIKDEVDKILFKTNVYRDAINRRILKTSIERR